MNEVSLSDVVPLIQEQLAQGNHVSIYPKGTSMLPMIRQGRDSVILSPVPEKLCKYDIPLYLRENGQYVLHRVISVGKTYTCMGDNQFQPESGLKHEQMIAVVTAFCRNGKVHTVDEVPYRIYCRLWHYSRPVRRAWRWGRAFLGRCLK